MSDYGSIEEIVAASMAKTVWRTVEQVWGNYQKICERSKVVPIWGQFETAVRRMRKEGRIIVAEGKAKLA